jgi:hypothetical protein
MGCKRSRVQFPAPRQKIQSLRDFGFFYAPGSQAEAATGRHRQYRCHEAPMRRPNTKNSASVVFFSLMSRVSLCGGRSPSARVLRDPLAGDYRNSRRPDSKTLVFFRNLLIQSPGFPLRGFHLPVGTIDFEKCNYDKIAKLCRSIRRVKSE